MTDPTPPNMSVDELLLQLIPIRMVGQITPEGAEDFRDGNQWKREAARQKISALLDTFAEKLIGEKDRKTFASSTYYVNLRNNLRFEQHKRIPELKKEIWLLGKRRFITDIFQRQDLR